MPLLVPVFVVATHERARPGSLVAAIERRGTWSVTALGVATAGLDAVLVGLAAAMAIAVADGVALGRLRRIAGGPRAPRTSRPATATIDFGVGGGAWEDAAIDGYRAPGHVARAYLGDGDAAMRVARRRWIASSVVAAVTLASASLATC